MKEYEHDKATVDAWLNRGGAEIVLETLRRRGWDIKIQTGDDWEFVDDVVVVGNREAARMEINGKKNPQKQAFFAILVYRRERPVRDRARAFRNSWTEFCFPMLKESDNFLECSISLCYYEIDEIRTSSEATAALLSNGCQIGGGKERE